MPKKKTTGKELNFEDALGRLESIVDELEGGELALESALKLFEEGVELGRRCGSQLEQAEKKISLLVEKADGSLSEQPLAETPPAAGDDTTDDDNRIPF